MEKDFNYYPSFLIKAEADDYFARIKESVKFTNELKDGDGNLVKINRSMAFCYSGDYTYKYSGVALESQPFSAPLLEIQGKLLGAGYDVDSVLLNLYKDGKEEIRWHSDKEDAIGPEPVIPMINLGASRTFWLLEKATGIKTPFLLNHGDLFVMEKSCQKNFLHAILKEKHIKESRISLTFRKMVV